MFDSYLPSYLVSPSHCERCTDRFVPAEITPIANATTALNPAFLADRRYPFFAAGLEPTRRGNNTALLAAQRRVWPVLLAWTHFTEAGDVQDSAGWLSCAKTTESKTVETNDGSRANRPGVKGPWREGLEPLEWMLAFWFMYFFLGYGMPWFVRGLDGFMVFLIENTDENVDLVL